MNYSSLKIKQKNENKKSIFVIDEIKIDSFFFLFFVHFSNCNHRVCFVCVCVCVGILLMKTFSIEYGKKLQPKQNPSDDFGIKFWQLNKKKETSEFNRNKKRLLYLNGFRKKKFHVKTKKTFKGFRCFWPTRKKDLPRKKKNFDLILRFIITYFSYEKRLFSI